MRKDLDIALLRAFLAVVESGGVTRAAAALGVSQAAASQQIKRLEEALDCRLFERVGRRLVLGPAGERLLAQARRLLALNDEVWSSMRTPSFEGEVRLGVPYDIIGSFVPAILRRFAKAQPRVRVSLVCEDSQVVREQLSIALAAARERGEPIDHVLLAGPPGLGKSTLAHIVASEMDTRLVTVSGPGLDRKGDLVAILADLAEGDVVFIDEVHRLNRSVEETLYPAMEDGVVDIIMGQGPGARSLRLDLAPFTLIGATTRASLLTKPLRDRFGLVFRLDHYSPPELVRIALALDQHALRERDGGGVVGAGVPDLAPGHEVAEQLAPARHGAVVVDGDGRRAIGARNPKPTS